MPAKYTERQMQSAAKAAEVWALLRKLTKAKGISIEQVGDHCRISPKTLYRIGSHGELSLASLNKIKAWVARGMTK